MLARANGGSDAATTASTTTQNGTYNNDADDVLSLDLDKMIYTLTQVISSELVERVGYVYQVA